MSEIQARPELVSPKALLDVRVRRAVAHGFDMPGVLEALTGGRGVITFTVTSPLAAYYPVVERVVTRREYDPQRARQMLEEAGMVRGADGFHVSPAGEPLRFELWSSGGATFERENRIFVDSLRQAGLEAIPQTISPVRMADTEFRAGRPGLFTTGAGNLDARLRLHSTSDIPGPHNRWQGNNRGGWQNAECERLWQAFNRTLDPSERVHQIAQMERLINEDVASIPHYLAVGVSAHTRHLEGPVTRMTPDAPRSIFHVENWAWRE
jgi:ABC-type transport system substrate-binding protein